LDPVEWLRPDCAALDSVVATRWSKSVASRSRTLVVMAADDERAASDDQLVATLPHGTRVVVPADH
jgi:hypothetical protein